MNDVRSRAPGSPPALRLQPGDIRLIGLTFAVVAVFTIMRIVFAVSVDLRVDEAYYWTWSKENVITYLDHPPMIAWFVRSGTFLFGDTNFGVRFTGLLSMLLTQLLLADIVWRVLRDIRYVVIAVLLPEVAPVQWFSMVKVTPDAALIPFALLMAWSLVRLSQSGDLRWWLPAGLFGGLALLSKYTAVLLLPAIVAFAIVPGWRALQLRSPYPWLAVLIAIAVFSPVLYWNAVHDWASFRFQLDRPAQISGWSVKFLLDFLGQQFALIGLVLLPVILMGIGGLAWRGYRDGEPIAILLATAVWFPLAFFVWRSFYGRVGDSWPLFVWPFAFAAVAINLKSWRAEVPTSRLTSLTPSIISGAILIAIVFIYYGVGNANYLLINDPVGKEASFARVVEAADKEREKAGAGFFVTTDYRIYSMLRWHLKDRVPVIQVNERSRYIGFRAGENAFAAPIGLYVAPKYDPIMDLGKTTRAVLEPVAEADMIWRGFRYDTYRLQTLRGWMPVLSPPPGDPFYVSSPH